jgi:hypothetical protein
MASAFPKSIRPAVAALFFQLGNFRAFYGCAGHDPFLTEHKPDYGLIDFCRVHGTLGADIDHCYRAIDTGLPVVAGTEFLQGSLIYEQQNNVFSLGSYLKSERSGHYVIVIDGFSVNSQGAFAVFATDDKTSLHDVRNDKNTLSGFEKLLSAVHFPPKAIKRHITADIDLLGRSSERGMDWKKTYDQ